VSEYVYPSKSVHITQKDLGKNPVLRISKNTRPKGVSFSPTVKKALEGVPFYYNRLGTEKLRRKDWKERKEFVKEGSEWNVYTPVRKRKAVVPATIDDFHRTGERRVLSKVRAKKIGRIKVRVSKNKWAYQWI
jgi:hypothetical protein